MLTFSVNKNLFSETTRILDTIDFNNLTQLEREYMSLMIFNYIDNPSKAWKYKDLGSFATTAKKFENSRKFERELNIVEDTNTLTPSDISLKDLMDDILETDKYLSYELVDYEMSFESLIEQFESVCSDIAVYEGVSIPSRLSHLFYTQNLHKNIKDDMLYGDKGVYTLFRKYKQEELLQTVIGDVNLFKECIAVANLAV